MTLATARRVLIQLRHDPRTVALIVVVPSVMMILLRYVFDSARVFDEIAPALLGFFPFLLMFLITSITTLRERRSGTLERLLTTPTSRPALLAGYAVAFTLVSLLQVVVAVVVSLWLGLQLAGSVWWLLLMAALDALLGVALGLFASAFAHSEFQAAQLMPVVVLPQLLLCGLLQPRDHMAPVLRWLSDVMPLSYTVHALQQVAVSPSIDRWFLRDVAVVAGCALLALGLAATTLRRTTR